MFRNQYDNDVTVWSPQGRIHQIEYAMEAVKQGAATVGLKSKSHAVLVALKRAPSELSSYQKKILPIDNHIGISIAGLTADARLISKFIRTECLNSQYVYNKPLPVARLVSAIGNRAQINTQRYGRRPYGVGLLVAGYDETGPHIYQTCPSANHFDCKAMAIGSRSQSARTYLERNLDSFLDSDLDELVRHGLRALRDTLPQDSEITTKNCSIAIVGKDTVFNELDEENIKKFLATIDTKSRSRAPPPDKPMEEEQREATPGDVPAQPEEPATEPMDQD